MKSWAPDFQFQQCPLKDVPKWDALRDFVWLDLGKIRSAATMPKAVLDALAGLQSQAAHPSLIFISGEATANSHREAVERVFSTFPRPENVEVDFSGSPDVLAALAKFKVLRQAYGAHRAAAAAAPPLKVPNTDLRAESGNLSADRISDLFGISLTNLATWIGRKKAAVSKTPDADSIQEGLQPFAGVARIRDVLPAEGFKAWLRTESPLLEGKTPLHWIEQGKVREVAEFVDDALTGQPS
jgi:hypothetical protein